MITEGTGIESRLEPSREGLGRQRLLNRNVQNGNQTSGWNQALISWSKLHSESTNAMVPSIWGESKQLSMPEHSSGRDEANQTIDRRGGGLSGLNSGVGSRPPTGSDNPCDGETNWSRGLVRVGETKSGKLLSGVEVQGTALSGCSPEKASDRRTKVGGDRKHE
ncbi:hypothetical protein L1987_15430 [Smallanthus sonchifolius]|uniref:Uncharacterized protein n=1 Tax=Smallanthus sonchifolius TaxID=185202 RepID=A0ACB9J6D4_9ASTR|nr:hypothetical protein L1987_15430 [Smallanthus sonchifolius]